MIYGSPGVRAAVVACCGVFLLGAGEPAQSRQASDDAAILKAVLTDTVEPLRVKYQPPRSIALERMSLARCQPSTTRSCIVQRIFDEVRREAAMGRWGFNLVAAFEKQAADRVDLRSRLADFRYANLIFDAPEETKRAHPTPLILCISPPVVVDSQSLLVVQFARTWTWILLLSKNESGWHVTKTITVGVS